MNTASTSTNPRRNPDAIYWTYQILGWVGYSIIGLLFSAQADGWRPELIVGYILYPFYSIALTHRLRREIRRWRATPHPVLATLAHNLLMVVSTGLVQTLFIGSVTVVFEGSNSLFHDPRTLSYVALGTTSATGMWVMLYTFLSANRHHREQQTQLQLALREAELSALEAQINPHFLFNCLNSIRALVAENPERAQDMITRLANIFRYNLHRQPSHTVPLASEVEVVTDYLALESVRFEDRLRVKFAIAPGAEKSPVPSMLLQTLVENALKHGISPRPGGGDLLIRAVRNPGSTRIEVENTGELGPPSENGVGLTNTRERLRILYGDRASLQLRDSPDGRVIATVLIPA